MIMLQNLILMFSNKHTPIKACLATLAFASIAINAGMAGTHRPRPYLESPIEFQRPGEPPLTPDELGARNQEKIARELDPKTIGKDDKADLAYGAYQRGFYLSAFNLALPRAEKGDAAAQTLIAEMYYYGQGVGLDRKKAAVWYRFAADAGNREAQFAYANLLAKGRAVKLDKKAARKYMKMAADAGHHKAQFNLAQMIVADKPLYAGYAEALPYYLKAAENGIPDAQYVMARIHATGNGVPNINPTLARKWMTLAAINGFDSAQLELGIWLATGKGGPKDEKTALKWFRVAAEQGNILAQNRLARMYAFGLGTKRNLVTASKWHVLARRAGKKDSRLEEIFRNLSTEEQKAAIRAANSWHSR